MQWPSSTRGNKASVDAARRLRWERSLIAARDPIAELDGQGNVTKRFVYGSRPHVPDYMVTYDQSGAETGTYRLVCDHLGSVRLVVDTSDGSVVERMRYDAFGNVLEDTKEGFEPFGFAGGLYDASTGLVRFGARDYDPRVGRWTAKDPLGFGGGDSNVYAYVGSDPINLVDLTGRFGWVAALGIGAVIGTAGYLLTTHIMGREPTLMGVGAAAVGGGIGGMVSFEVGAGIAGAFAGSMIDGSLADIVGGIGGGIVGGGTSYSIDSAVDPDARFSLDGLGAACVVGGATEGLGSTASQLFSPAYYTPVRGLVTASETQQATVSGLVGGTVAIGASSGKAELQKSSSQR